MTLATVEKGVYNSVMITWENLLANTEGQAVELPSYMDKTVHIFGVFSGATVTIEGSNDPRVLTDPGNASWVQLVDPHQIAISVSTGDSIEVILENPRFIRAVVTNGDVDTNMTVIICARKGA